MWIIFNCYYTVCTCLFANFVPGRILLYYYLSTTLLHPTPGSFKQRWDKLHLPNTNRNVDPLNQWFPTFFSHLGTPW